MQTQLDAVAGGDGDAATVPSRYVLEAKSARPARGLHEARRGERK